MNNRSKQRRADRIALAVANIVYAILLILLFFLGSLVLGIDRDSDAFLVGLLLVGLLAPKVDE